MSYFAFSSSLAKRFSIPNPPEEVPEPPPPGGYQDIVDAPDGGAPPIVHLRLATTSQIVDRKSALASVSYTGTGQTLVSGLPTDSDGAINFAGTASGSLAHVAALDLAAFSLSFWFRVPTLPIEAVVWHILSKELSGFNAGDFLVRIDGGGGLTINFQSAADDFAIAVPVAIEAGTTYHLCVRADGTGVDAYLNGQFLSKNTGFTDAWASNVNPLQLALAPFSAEPANVILDEIAIYDRVLTVGEVLALALQEAGAPVATADDAVVPESATTAIDVLSNDTFVGTPTLEVMSQPAGGDSAAVNGSQIDYTAGAVASDTARSFTYRITDANGTSNTATVNVTVQDSGFVPASNANPFTIPGATSEVLSPATMANLQTRVNAAAPGHHILIPAGTYSGSNLTLNPQGTEASPIVIRPQGARGSVTINGGNWTLANTSERGVITNLFFNGTRIVINGDHNRISRCRWRQLNGVAINFLLSRDGRVDHCDFSDYIQGTQTKRIINWEPGGFDSGTNVRNRLDYCYVHDLNYSATNQGNGNEPFIWSAEAANFSLSPAGGVGVIDHCLFTNHAVLGEAEYIALKSGGWKVSFCTFDNIDFYIQFRSGDNGEIRSCWFEQMNGFNIFGSNHLFIGNRFAGGINVRVGAGNATSAQLAAGSVTIGHYARSDGCQIIGNRMGSGRLLVGGYWSVTPSNPNSFPTLPALGNNLFGNTRDSGGDAHSFATQTLLNGNAPHSGTTFNNPGGGSEFDFVVAVKIATPTLTSGDQVGMFAADPLCPDGPQS